ncbi:MAG: matrixin family metalloprotease [Cyanobacteria bacterium SZAS LIN-2]|nr:matrixin family metalloprotease [Cyanobacteria bacterium SZAS LIN-2]
MLPVVRIKHLKSLMPAAATLVSCLLTLLALAWVASLQSALALRPAALQPGTALAASVYPQFKSNVGTIHWLKEQMPLKVYISHGLTLDSVMDPALGAPIANIDNLPAWPKLVAALIERPEKWKTLTQAGGFLPGHYQAAKEGVLAWKIFEPEGLIKYELTEDPEEADIYVFFTHHFVTKLGMALFANDIRGYTSKTNFSYAAIMRGAKANFQPVVCVLRTTDNQGQPMPLGKMKAAAMHEFGHALGIEGHSTNNGDLMSIYYGRGVISPNDADTLRYLYHLTPDLIP